MKHSLLKNNWFSFYLTDTNEKAKSHFILGKPLKEHYKGKIKWHKVTQKKYWEVAMDDVYINGKPIGVCQNKCKLVIDTGTSIMTGPSSDLNNLLQRIRINNCQDLSNLPTISFKINDTHYKMKPKEYILFSKKSNNSNQLSRFLQKNSANSKKLICKRAFMPLDVEEPRGPLWVLGDIFIRKYFVIFDRNKKRIGLAKRRKNVRN